MSIGPEKSKVFSAAVAGVLGLFRSLRAVLAVLFFSVFLDAPDAQAQAVDLALVLVIDNSGSIDAGESVLQFGGYAEAFRSPELVKEMTAGPNGAIAVSVLVFSDVVRSLGGWHIIDGQASASVFADAMESASQTGEGGTHIAQALDAAVMELASCPYLAQAATIDLSGDGPDNEGEILSAANLVSLFLAIAGVQTAQWTQQTQQNAYRLRQLRDSIASRGVSINCVAIQDPGLKDYFEKYVICGKSSFAVLASSFQSFRNVIKRKIIREVQQGVRRSVEKSDRKTVGPKAKSPSKMGDTQEVTAESKDKNAGLGQDPKTDGVASHTAEGGAAKTQDHDAAVATLKRIRKEIVVTVREAETKLPVSDVKISLGGSGENFAAEPNGSLPGQFVVSWETTEGAAISLRVEAPGHAPKNLQIDNREPARYEVELERLPIQFIL